MSRIREAVRFEREIQARTRRLGHLLEQADPMLAGLFLSMADEADCHLRWLDAVERAGGPDEAATPEPVRDCRTSNRARVCCRA